MVAFTEQVFRAFLFSTCISVQTEDFALVYSTVVVRFVKLLMDSAFHNTGKPQLNALAAAAEMQAPSWIVHMRHAVCHRGMPSVKELDRAVNFIHAWLWVGLRE